MQRKSSLLKTQLGQLQKENLEKIRLTRIGTLTSAGAAIRSITRD